MSEQKEQADKPKAKSTGIDVRFVGDRTVLSRWPQTAKEKADIEAKRQKARGA